MPQIAIGPPVGTVVEVPAGTPILELAVLYQDRFAAPIMLAKVDNQLEELTWLLNTDCALQFIDTSFSEGLRVYERGTGFIFIAAARELFPGCRVTLEHHISNGLYGEVHYERPIVARDLERIEQRMRALVQQRVPFERVTIPRDDAVRLFEDDGQVDKVKLLRTGSGDSVEIYRCGNYCDSFYGHMPPDSGFMPLFHVRSYMPGFIIQMPDAKHPNAIAEFVEQKKLAAVFAEAERWGRILGVGGAGQLNDHMHSGEGGDLVRVAEALHEKRIAQIADTIAADKENLRVILVAGPSSSGKTTFAQRLSVQLRVNGLRPLPISLDDYFVSRDNTPLDESGRPDFEALEAVDTALFNDDLQRLIQGEPVSLPTFSFLTGEREYRRSSIRVAADQPLIIEGIHGLNDRLTETIPTGNKYRIYVSALTTLNLDDHNRIPTTDVRLLRRIVRDSQFRSHDALETIRIWPSVRLGEKKNIFPFQENADVMFNSGLVYELSVLRAYAEPLLSAVPRGVPEYAEAARLLRFLEYFHPLEESRCSIPPNSIMREFIGGSCFI